MGYAQAAMKDPQILYKGQYLALVTTDGYEHAARVKGSGVVCLVPVTDQGELVLVEQFRPAVGNAVIEIPAGLVGDEDGASEESFEAAAHRELLEETGYEAGHLEYLGEWPTTAGMSSEKVRVYRATGLKRRGKGGGDASENILVHVVPLAELRGWLAEKERQGYYLDPKIFAAVFFVKEFFAVDRGPAP
jgi:ADP-ribose pyrophosphatase